MKKIIILLITVGILGIVLVEFKAFDGIISKLERESNVVSNVEIAKGKDYTDKDSVVIVNNEQFLITLTGTNFDFSDKRNLMLQVHNKTSEDISIKIQSATTDGKGQEANFTEPKIEAHEKLYSRAIIFEDKTDFKKSSGELVVMNYKSGKVLGTYKYDVKVVPGKQKWRD